MNQTIAAYIASGKTQRRFNIFFIAIHCLVVATGAYTFVTVEGSGQVLVAALGGVCVVGLLQGFANVALILVQPRIVATDDEIVAAAAGGPPWFRRLVAQAANSKTGIA